MCMFEFRNNGSIGPDNTVLFRGYFVHYVHIVFVYISPFLMLALNLFCFGLAELLATGYLILYNEPKIHLSRSQKIVKYVHATAYEHILTSVHICHRHTHTNIHVLHSHTPHRQTIDWLGKVPRLTLITSTLTIIYIICLYSSLTQHTLHYEYSTQQYIAAHKLYKKEYKCDKRK